ncbi:MAG: ECF-type sigma factor [Pyrinomonadaceae bacterium]
MPLVYAELHRQAARYLRNERRYNSVQTTALIHEAYIRLVDQTDIHWQEAFFCRRRPGDAPYFG